MDCPERPSKESIRDDVNVISVEVRIGENNRIVKGLVSPSLEMKFCGILSLHVWKKNLAHLMFYECIFPTVVAVL
jgi:hypothetical protein